MSGSYSLSNLQERCTKFLIDTGRRPRILLSHIQKAGSSRQLKALAIVFSDVGFDVDIGPGFYSHTAVAKMACENDVHVVGISGGYSDPEAVIRDLNRALAQFGEDNIKIYVETKVIDGDSDFENRATRSAAETLALIGA